MSKTDLEYDHENSIAPRNWNLPGVWTDEGNTLYKQLVAISKPLAKAENNWTLIQKKLFIMCLTKIKWTEKNNSNIVQLDKKEIKEALGLKINDNDLSRQLRREFQGLATKALIRWTDPADKKNWKDGFLIINWASYRGYMEVTFNPVYMNHLENLVNNLPFITIWSNDIYSFKSDFSYRLFMELRNNYDTRYLHNVRIYSTKQTKDIFGLEKDDYMRKDGTFNRSMFEKKVINRAITEINAGDMIQILHPAAQKNKSGGKVSGYRFDYVVRTKKASDTQQPES